MQAMMLQVVPAGVFSTAYDVLENGQSKGRIEHRMLSMRDEAIISAGERTFSARRPRAFRSAAVLESPEGTLLANAEKETFWRENYRIELEGSTLYLRQQMMSWRGTFTITDEAGEIGSIRREKAFSRRMLVELTTASPPPLEVAEFLVWIVLMVQRRQTAAS